MQEANASGKNTVLNPIDMGLYAPDAHNAQRFILVHSYVQNEVVTGVHPDKPYPIRMESVFMVDSYSRRAFS